MSRETVIIYRDDLDGSDAIGTFHFGVDGWLYEIDLSEDNHEELRAALVKFAEAGRKLGRLRMPDGSNAATPKATPGVVPSVRTQEQRKHREYLQAVRDWAKSAGIEVADRGRIKDEVINAYEAGRTGAPAPAATDKLESVERPAAPSPKDVAKKAAPAKKVPAARTAPPAAEFNPGTTPSANGVAKKAVVKRTPRTPVKRTA